MPRIAKPPLTTEEYQKAMERSEWIRKALRTQELPVYAISAWIGRNPHTVYDWLRHGLTEDQFDILQDAITRLSLAMLADGGHGHE
jgi:hypothetical protein